MTISTYQNSYQLIQECCNDTPTTILWSQTLETVTLRININQVQVLLTENYLKLATENQTVTLPLYNSIYMEQVGNEEIHKSNRIILKKEAPMIWPHLLTQQSDEEVSNYLLDSNFLIQIQQQQQPQRYSSFDILDFDTVINGDGQKTGLE